jgi:AraC family transcriptional regulator, regulatory protein of adaptative response / methylated-DNA-[protein]-cysteine methyltransferase
MDLNNAGEFARTDSPITGQRDAPAGGIAFATGPNALGTVLVARSTRGVCAILIGSGAGELIADLAAQFPDNKLVSDDQKLEGDLEKLLGFIENPGAGLDLDLDIRGTAFQRRVWDALCAIPSGRAVTYAALAHRIGEPDAIRAVANACAANALALAIPCHRVIRSDGTISGYRWGVERKRALLACEARHQSDPGLGRTSVDHQHGGRRGAGAE